MAGDSGDAAAPPPDADEALYHLCFDPAEFRDDEDFTPAAFLVEKRRHVPIETLARDLETYREHLQDQVVRLVNTDVYDTFLSVTNKLHQREGELRKLQQPLPELARRVGAACDKLEERKARVGAKLGELASIERSRRFVQQKLRLCVSEHRLLRLLRRHSRTATPETPLGQSLQPGSTTSTPASTPLAPAAPSDLPNGVPNGVPNGAPAGDPDAEAPAPSWTPAAAGLRPLLAMAEECQQQEFDNRRWVPGSADEEAARHTVSSRLGQLRGHVRQLLRDECSHAMRRHYRLLCDLEARASPPPADAAPPEPPGAPPPAAGAAGGGADGGDGEGGAGAEAADAAECVRTCLAALATAEQEADAPRIFRKEVCDPAVEEALSYRAAQKARSSAGAVRELFARLTDLWERRLRPAAAAADAVRGDFGLVAAAWRSVADTIGKRMLFLFENGSPLLFHQRYVSAHGFVAALERGCADAGALRALRQSTEMVLWRSRWNLEVYYKMREITLAKQIAQWFPPPESWQGPCPIRAAADLPSPPPGGADDAIRLHREGFAAAPAAALYSVVCWCVSTSVFLLPLGHRFLRLCLLACLGLQRWLHDAIGSHTLPVLDAGGELLRGDARAPDRQKEGDRIGAADLVRLHADLAHLRSLLREDFAAAVARHFDPHWAQQQQQEPGADAAPAGDTTPAAAAVEHIIDACLAAMAHAAQDVSVTLTSVVAQQCIAEKLQGNVVSLKAQYRMTKKAVPTRASFWASAILEPLRQFKGELAARPDPCPPEVVDGWTAEVVTMVTAKYRSVARETLLQAKKQEESLTAFRRKKGGEKGDKDDAPGGGERPKTSEMTDTDKIVVQMYLDVREFGNQVRQHGIDVDSFPPYKRLLDSVLRGAWLKGEAWVKEEPAPIGADE